MTALTTLALTAAKAALLLGAAAALALLLRHASARLRALVWATAVCGSLLVPVLAVVGPSLEVALPLPAAPAAADVTAREAAAPPLVATRSPQPAPAAAPVRPGQPAPARREIPWPAVAVGLWLAGALLVLARQATGWGRAVAAVRRARTVDDPGWRAAMDDARRRAGCRRPVRLLASPDLGVPATLGLLDPVVVLPEHGLRWLAGRRDAVLLHELVHVARGDWAVRILARLAVAVYWFNPLAWWAVRRLELEQEIACDETVLALGEPAVDYARHLLAAARQAARRPACAVPVAGMARRHEVEERIMAILDRRRIRPVTRTTLAGVVVVTAALVPALAAVQPETRRAGSELTAAVQELRELEKRLEPYHERMEAAAAEIELEAGAIEAMELVDEEALARIETEMAPYLERIEAIEIDMEPFEEQMEAVAAAMEDLDFDFDDATIADINRQIEQQLAPHLAEIERLQLDLEPMQEQLEQLHRQLEPLHEHLAGMHQNLAPRQEEIARLQERLEPMHRALEEVHAEMEPLHRELEAVARRVESALTTELANALRERFGSVVAPGAPWAEAAARIVDEGSLHLEDDLVRIRASRSEVREILTDVLTRHRIGSEDAFAAALEQASRDLSRFEIEVP